MNKKSIFSKVMVLLFALVAIVGLAQAQTTYTFSDYPAGVQYATETHVLDDDVTLYTVKCHFTQQLRVYSNSTNNSYFYTNGLPFYIDSLGFNMGHSVDDVNIYGSTDGDSWTLVGTIEVTASAYNDYTLSFGDNNYNYFKFDVAGSYQIRVKSMTIYYKTTGPQGEAAAAPVISPSSGIYSDPVTVTISKSSEVGSIHYTLDETTPSAESAVYTEPFTVNSTTTVKAVTIAEGMLNSSVVSATYTFPAEIANIAAFKAGNANIPYSLTNGVTFVYRNGAYTYVKDASAGLLVYDNSGVIATEYEEGDQIADLVGTRTVYASQVEMVPSMNTSEATENTGAVEPIVVTIEELKENYSAYDAQLVTIENVVFPGGYPTSTSGSTPSAQFVQGEDTLLLYSRFDYDTELDANANMNVTGFVGIYNNNIQIYPRDNNDIVEYVQVLSPELTITAPLDGAEFSTVDTLPVGIEIGNFTLGVDGYLKLESEFIGLYAATNTLYLDQELLNYLQEEITLNPLPSGTHTIYASLVGMDSLELDPAVSQSVTFTVNKFQIPAPEISPNGGTFADNVEVTINYDEEFNFYTNIVYTLDGSEPTEESELYLSPITLNESATLKVKAFIISFLADYYASSETVSADFVVVSEPVLTANPTALSFSSTELSKTFTVSGAHLTEPISLVSSNPHFTLSTEEIENPNSNTQVTVTFDGTESANGVISINSGTYSAEVSLAATAKLPAPELMSTATVSDSNIVVTITCSVADAVIHYTLDGTEPTAGSDVYSAPIVFNTVGSYTVKAFAVKENWESSDVVVETYQVVAPTVGDEVVYATGFEASEGFEASTVYNNTNIKYFGNEGEQWGTFYGTPSEYNIIDGGQSMQMRWYSSAQGNLGYVFTNFDIRNVTHVTFKAANSNGLKVNVAHSIDGGSTYSEGETFDVTSTANEFDYIVSETGEYDYVRLRFAIEMPSSLPNSTSRLVIDNVQVYGVPGLAPTIVSAPLISPESNVYYEPQTVTIASATEGAEIRYTIDGTEPDENSIIYSTPFTVAENTTIKAKAWKEGLTPSYVSTATISFPVQAANIAAFKSNTSDDVQQIMSDVTFVFRSGRYIFVEDSTAALLIYDNADSVIKTDYEEGDVIHAGVFGKYKLYNGLVELEPTYNSPESITSVTVEPVIADISNIKNNYATVYESKFVRINDVEFIDDQTFVKNGDTMQIFDRFNTVEVEISAGMIADVIGFVNYSNNNGYQLFPRSNEDVVVKELEKVANPVFSFQLSGEFYFMDITCATEGADIYYTIDGTNPNENSYHFTSQVPLQPEPLTIKAVAMKDGMQNSDIVTYYFTGINKYENKFSIYPNPTSDVLVVESMMIESFEIFNMEGQKIKSGIVGDSTAKIGVHDLAKGSYIVRIKDKAGLYSKTFVKN